MSLTTRHFSTHHQEHIRIKIHTQTICDTEMSIGKINQKHASFVQPQFQVFYTYCINISHICEHKHRMNTITQLKLIKITKNSDYVEVQIVQVYRCVPRLENKPEQPNKGKEMKNEAQ